ncbi:hypothetical protein KAZ01_01830 [Candidatus Gracilibacteria bacterium]|nr:hypothetical protein [Candidatus Gracilibacteria bacterium]
MVREPSQDKDIIEEYKKAKAQKKKLDKTAQKPTGNTLGTAKIDGKKVV